MQTKQTVITLSLVTTASLQRTNITDRTHKNRRYQINLFNYAAEQLAF